MRIVITGASGFIGGAIFNQLAVAGFDCLGVSRSKHPGLHQVANYSDAPVADCLIHCAETNDRSLANEGGKTLEDEAHHTLSILLAKGYRHVVYTSSATLYGDQWSTPRKVTDQVAAVDVYTRIKRMSEEMVLKSGGVVARLANIYGPCMPATNVLNHVLNQLGSDGAITMQTLKPIRDFLWVDDAVRALATLAEHKISGIFNVGSGRGVSIKELVGLVQHAAGTSKPVMGLRMLDQPSHLVLDIAHTRQYLSWAPEISLEEGIRELVEMKMKCKI